MLCHADASSCSQLLAWHAAETAMDSVAVKGIGNCAVASRMSCYG